MQESKDGICVSYDAQAVFRATEQVLGKMAAACFMTNMGMLALDCL